MSYLDKKIEAEWEMPTEDWCVWTYTVGNEGHGSNFIEVIIMADDCGDHMGNLCFMYEDEEHGAETIFSLRDYDAEERHNRRRLVQEFCNVALRELTNRYGNGKGSSRIDALDYEAWASCLVALMEATRK